MNTDTLVERQNQRRWASCRVTGDSPQSDSSSPRSSCLARLPAGVAALLPLAEPARKNKKLPAERLRAIIQLPAPEVIAQEIVEDLQAALEQFKLIAGDLGADVEMSP